ncbi:DUF1329 domain-containing protein [Pseudomonas sp. PDM31]|uniref:DUF1329 domain-containing protein n=1 Tax=Pseudomonas sp. PDM31 TaxID=2854778 RepID=UPI001C46C71D|nr:DUF1329 domain-containing protein [Pseudomonas sp. PDM31]MBV7477532.1 DUF1329 domain-containing protein [Pseudomonas sp. PDM31]
MKTGKPIVETEGAVRVLSKAGGMLAVGFTLLFHPAVHAAPGASPEELKQLGTTRTPWGAEIAGNQDGTIPAYTGGVKPPAGAPAFADSIRPVDPYAADKPVLTISAANMAQYAGKLTEGTQALLKRWPDYKVEVYPTRRSYPQMAADRAQSAIKNAANPECKTTDDGVGIRGCWGATPFPLPKTGYQVMWNSLTHEQSETELRMQSWIVDSAGNRTMTNEAILQNDYPFWDQKVTPYEGVGELYWRFLSKTLGPSRDAGQKTVVWYPAEFDSKDQRIWSYTTGQRRTRLAPELTYDTPSASLSGALNYDEIGLFAGRMDRFDFKLVGRQEMYVPYNRYKVITQTPEQLLGKQFVNPDATRWELHRVWLVEATRKEGKRHIAAKRRFYIDEDSWAILSSEAIDDAGKIFRVGQSNGWAQYNRNELGAAGNQDSCITTYDLSKGQYLVSSYINPDSGWTKQIKRMPDYNYRAESMAGTGVR